MHEWIFERDRLRKLRAKYDTYQLNARKRYLDFELSFAEFKRLLLADCHYCGNPPNAAVIRNISGQGEHIVRPTVGGIDRVNNSAGYVKGNCVACCHTCNWMKGVMREGDFLDHVRRVADRNHK